MFSLSRSERSTQNPEVIFAANLVMEVPSPETLLVLLLGRVRPAGTNVSKGLKSNDLRTSASLPRRATLAKKIYVPMHKVFCHEGGVTGTRGNPSARAHARRSNEINHPPNGGFVAWPSRLQKMLWIKDAGGTPAPQSWRCRTRDPTVALGPKRTRGSNKKMAQCESRAKAAPLSRSERRLYDTY